MRRVWLLTLVFMLLLAACAHPRPLGEGRSEGGSASLPTVTPLPPTATRPPATPTSTPMPTPTPGPEALKGEIYPYLDHYLGRPEATFVSDKTLWGTTRLSPPDNHLFAAYGIVQDGANEYVLVSNGINADLVPADKVPQDVLSSLHKLDLTTDEARTKIDRSRAWMYYMENFRLGKFTLHLRSANGSKHEDLVVDTKRFLEDREYGIEILKHIYGEFDIASTNRVGVYIRNPNRYERQHIEDLYDGMRMIYYYTNFIPEGGMFGGFDYTDVIARPINREVKGVPDGIYLGYHVFEMPMIETLPNGRKWVHTNIDIKDIGAIRRDESFPIYNPFTPDVKPRAVRVHFWQSTDRGTLYASLLVRVTDPDTGKSLYFEFEHLTAAHRENGRWAPENELWERVLMRGSMAFVDVSISLDQGQLLGYVSDPKTDPHSTAYHVQFGQVYDTYRWIRLGRAAVYNPYTAALQVYFMTHQADKYRSAWDEEPQGSGFWIGNKHVVSYTPSVPAVPVRDVNTLPYVPVKPGKKKPGWMDQLPASARFSKHPKGFYRRRA